MLLEISILRSILLIRVTQTIDIYNMIVIRKLRKGTSTEDNREKKNTTQTNVVCNQTLICLNFKTILSEIFKIIVCYGNHHRKKQRLGQVWKLVSRS